jgi:hypothetical protein
MDSFYYKSFRKKCSSIKVILFFQRIFLVSCLFTTVLFLNTIHSLADSNLLNITWSKEEILASIEGVQKQSFFPVIAADPYGGVHVFWTQGNAIYYRYKEGLSWSLPIDVVWSEAESITFPSVVVDQDGILYLAWFSYGEIRFKSVPSWEAGNVHKWSTDKTIGYTGGSGTPLRMAVDAKNRLHIVFADWYGTEPGNVYHMLSIDGGETWSNPLKISSISQRQLATDPRIAIDDQGQAHIVWGLMDQNQEGLQLGVYYARLDSDGNLLEDSVEIAHRQPSDKWFMAINVAVRGEEVHLIWVCGEQAQRCQTWSENGGGTWLPYQRVFKELIGLSGWDALVVDGADNLVWLTVLRYPQGMYSSAWEENSWTDPPLIASTDPYMKLGENVMAVVGSGNQIHVVVQLGNTISYMFGKTPAERKPLQPKPGAQITPTPNASTDTPISSEVLSTSVEIQNFTWVKTSNFSTGNILLISSLAVLLFIFLITLVYRFIRR